MEYLSEITLDGLIEYVNKTRDEYDKNWSSCWNCAAYVRHICNSDLKEDGTDYPHTIDNFHDMYKCDGIYHCTQDIFDKKIWLVSTYGGTFELTKKCFDKKEKETLMHMHLYLI